MKVLQVTTNYPTSNNPAFGIFMKEQVDSLEQFGVVNTIFFSNGSEIGVGKKFGGMWVHARAAIKLGFHLLMHHYDLIHCHSVIAGLILLCSGGAFFNKCVLSLQNDPENKNDSDSKFFRLLYPFFNQVIVKKPLVHEYKKVIYLPNGCNMDFFRPMNKSECKKQLGLDLEKRYILFVDSNTAKKRTQKRKDRFDAVLSLLHREYGYANLEELVMIGVVRSNVPIYINSCDAHLLCSDLEGSPNSVKECMCCNVPVVATNVGNVRDLFEGVEQCYVSRTFDPKELAFLLNKVLADTRRCTIRETIKEKELDMASVAKKLYSVYVNVCNR